MTSKLKNLIETYERNGDFTYSKATNKLLTEAERSLGCHLPDEYKHFLKTFGHGGIGGIEVLGIGRNGAPVFVSETLKYRSYGMPDTLILIENCDEWLYCLDSSNGKIVMWSTRETKPMAAFEDFEAYLLDRIKDVIENM